MTAGRDGASIGAFACELGDEECEPRAIPDFDDIWESHSQGTDFGAMGCGTFRKMTAPLAGYVGDCVSRTLKEHGTAPQDAGVHPSKLHFAPTLRAYGHCGNCDWMLNLIDYQRIVGLRSGATFLAQASAPGFFACALLGPCDERLRALAVHAPGVQVLPHAHRGRRPDRPPRSPACSRTMSGR